MKNSSAPDLIQPITFVVMIKLTVLIFLGCGIDANAAELLQKNLVGTWVAVPAPSEKRFGKIELYLATDGLGVMIGPSQKLAAVENSGSRGMGVPIKVRLSGEFLTANPFIPDDKILSQKAKNLSLECAYHAAELKFTCVALPDKIEFFLIRRNHDLSPEFEDFLNNIRKANAQ